MRGKEIGLVINDNLYLYNITRDINLLKDTQKLKYNYFNFSLKTDSSKESNGIFDFTDFRNKNKDEKLTETLSRLENNLYLENINLKDLDENLQNFFKESYLIQNKEFENFHFFINPEKSEAEKFILGIYNNSNEQLHNGDRVKGLKCWIDKESKEIKSYENYSPVKDASKIVCHLSPEYAFYYKEKFFEDYLEDMLNEIKSENPTIELEFSSNNTFYYTKKLDCNSPLEKKSFDNKILQEFDFIINVKKDDGTTKNIVLEAKTKLSKFIVEEQCEKVQKYIKNDNLKIFDEYLLIGFNTDTNMESLQYFRKKYKIDYINDLENAFKYPLPETDDKLLYCISSNNYDKLKTSLIKIFRNIE